MSRFRPLLLPLALAVAVAASLALPTSAHAAPVHLSEHVVLPAVPKGWTRPASKDITLKSRRPSIVVVVREGAIAPRTSAKSLAEASARKLKGYKRVAAGRRVLLGGRGYFVRLRGTVKDTPMVITLLVRVEGARVYSILWATPAHKLGLATRKTNSLLSKMRIAPDEQVPDEDEPDDDPATQTAQVTVPAGQ